MARALVWTVGVGCGCGKEEKCKAEKKVCCYRISQCSSPSPSPSPCFVGLCVRGTRPVSHFFFERSLATKELATECDWMISDFRFKKRDENVTKICTVGFFSY